MANIHNLDQLKELSLSELIELSGKGLVLDVENDNFSDEEYDREYIKKIPMTHTEILNALNMDDEAEDGSADAPLRMEFYAISFDTIRDKMNDILGNSKLMKLIRKQGVGEVIPPDCQVSIKYLGFFEYQDEPFDSTFAHNHNGAVTIRLNQGNLIPGLELGISTMQKHETSLFLIHHDLAYGQLGCMPRIPPNAEVLFVVSLIEYVDNAAADTYEQLTQDEKRSFKVVQSRVKDVLNTGRDSFGRKKYRQAIREFNKAVNWLESTKLNNDEEEEEMNRLLSKAYVNLAVCYNVENRPRQACIACNRNPIPSAKSYFNHGRALARIGEYEEAMKKLQEAHKLEINNKDIINEIALINDQIKKYKTIEKKLWANCLKVKKEAKIKTEFEKAAEEMCETFLRDIKLLRQPLPDGLTSDEEKCIRIAAAARGLSVTNHLRFGKETIYLNKPNY